MSFGTLIHETMLPAPNPVLWGDTYVGNPDDALYEALGYKPLVLSPQPVPQGDGYYAERWAETDAEIVQSWEWVETPEISDSEALSILTGGD